MRKYLFIAATVERLSKSGLQLLTPEVKDGGLPAQRWALQTDGEYPDREALLTPLGDDLWQVMPLTDRDWTNVLTEVGLPPMDVKQLEQQKPAEAAACLYAKAKDGQPTGVKRMPCVLVGDDPVIEELAKTEREK